MHQQVGDGVREYEARTTADVTACPGLGYETLSYGNLRLICCSFSGFGAVAGSTGLEVAINTGHTTSRRLVRTRDGVLQVRVPAWVDSKPLLDRPMVKAHRQEAATRN